MRLHFLAWTFLLLFLVPLSTAMEECTGITTPNGVPCQIITTWDYENACNTYTIKIYNSTPSLIGKTTLTDYTGTSRCNSSFNFTKVGTYTFNITESGDSGSIHVRYEVDTMASFAIMFFMILITAVVFYVAWKSEFLQESPLAHYITKKLLYIIGMFLLALDFTIALAISDNFGIGVNNEMALMLFFAHRSTYVIFVAMFLTATINGLKLWKWEKQKRRMGYE